MDISLFNEKTIAPFKFLGLKSSFWNINIETLIYTWISMFIMFVLIFVARLFMKKDLNPVALLFEQCVSFFDDLCRESFGSSFKYQYFAFSSTIFFFTLFGCLMGLLPFLDETTKDLNTTFAIGTLSFTYVQYQKIKVHGIWEYFKEFTQPLFILLPLNIIGELAKIASMSFRLFGNILGGSIIFLIAVNALAGYKEFFMILALVTLVAYLILNKFINIKEHKIINFILKSLLIAVFFLAFAQLFFGVFEGFVQSFVITMLTITYLSVAIQEPEEHL